MNRTIVKSAVAVAFSTGLLIGGMSPAFATAEGSPVSALETGSSALQGGSSSGSREGAPLFIRLLCALSGGTYSGSSDSPPITCAH